MKDGLQIIFGDEIDGLSLPRYKQALMKTRKWDGKTIRMLTTSAAKLYYALIDKGAVNMTRFVTFTISEAKRKGLADKTLARAREELIQRDMIVVGSHSRGSYIYEIVNPLKNRQITHLTDQLFEIGHAIKKTNDGQMREYSSDEVKQVFDFFLGEHMTSRSQDFQLFYACPFHTNHEARHSSLSEPLTVSTYKNMWVCLDSQCDRRARGRGARLGGGDVLEFVAGYRMMLDLKQGYQFTDAARMKLGKPQAREVIAQILSGRAKTIDDLVYTDLQKHAETIRVISKFDNTPKFDHSKLKQSTAKAHINSIFQRAQETAA